MRYAKFWIGILNFILAVCSCAWSQDPGWPRELVKPGGKLIVYQPQVDEWKNFNDITWRQAFQLTPTGGSEIVGAASFEGTTEVNTETHTVFMFNIRTLNTYFPEKDPAASAQLDQLLRSFVPQTYNASLDRLIAYLPKPQSVQTVNLRNDPPFIFVSYSPAILLGVDGEPVLSEIPKTDLKFVVNTMWPLFFDKNNSQYYLELNPTTAAAQARVDYTGSPQFAPIEGTTLHDRGNLRDQHRVFCLGGAGHGGENRACRAGEYATNTPDKVIRVGDLYYLCLQGVWFMSTAPQGP